MSKTYNFDSYDITLSKSTDSIVIRYLDRNLFKVFQKVFTQFEINEICPIGLDNFCQICFHTIENHFTQSTNSNSSVQIDMTESMVNIFVDYKVGLHFGFTLELPLIDDPNISATDLYVKKLEEDIVKLRNDVKNMEEYIFLPTFLHTCKCNWENQLFLPISCNKITINFTNSRTNTENNDNGNFIISCHCCDKYLHPAFKKHRCDTIEIKSSVPPSYAKNLPTDYLKHLIVENNSGELVSAILKEYTYLQLQTLKLQACDLTKLNSEYLYKTKELILQGCSNVPTIPASIKVTYV